MIDYTLIGKRIQTQRLEKGITQEKLAELTAPRQEETTTGKMKLE